MIERAEYRRKEFYRDSIKLINDFINDILESDIDRLKTFCFRDLEDKYSWPKVKNLKLQGWKFDCDDTALARAIYCVIWGYIFNIKDDEIGPHTKAPYRGDTMNSFNTLFGKEENNEFSPRAKSKGLDEDIESWNNIENFYDKYHTIGNFILIPNKGDINGGRGNFRAFGDYFDLFLLEIQYLIEKENSKGKEWFRDRLQKNPFYSQYSMNEIKNIFFLDDYISEEGKVKKFIETSRENRLKIANKSKAEYKKLVDDYISKSEEVIANRADKIIEVLKEELKEAEKMGILKMGY